MAVKVRKKTVVWKIGGFAQDLRQNQMRKSSTPKMRMGTGFMHALHRGRPSFKMKISNGAIDNFSRSFAANSLRSFKSPRRKMENGGEITVSFQNKDILCNSG